ncbi:conserved hypothetical protein [Vibrio phage 501E54-1]|nr:conserved hypothetical protein [Vibrio phage 501E54-1]
MPKQIIYTKDFDEPDHEIILKLKSDDFDWVDPIQKVYIEDGILTVDNGRGVYDYVVAEIEDYKIREYSPENIFDYKGGNL